MARADSDYSLVALGALALGGYAALRAGGVTIPVLETVFQQVGKIIAAVTGATSSSGAGNNPTSGPHTLSAAGLAFIKAGEGFQANRYDDVGHQAIGYGHDIKPGETIHAPITEAQATSLLLGDVAIAAAAINSGVKVQLTQNEFDALVSFVLDVGTGAFASSTLLKKLNAGDMQGAADQFPLWKYVTSSSGQKTVSNALVARRGRERTLFLT